MIIKFSDILQEGEGYIGNSKKTVNKKQSRGKIVSPRTKDAIKVIQKYAPWYGLNNHGINYDIENTGIVNQNTNIYRGISNSTANFILYNSVNKNKRINSEDDFGYKNGNTIHNNIIDKLPSWKNIPKRLKSIIGTTDEDNASGFGEVYRVIPLKENSKFATADLDFVTSFSGGLFKIFCAFTFNRVINFYSPLSELDDLLKSIGINEKSSMSEIKNKINNNTHRNKSYNDLALDVLGNPTISEQSYLMPVKNIIKNGTSFDLLCYILQPPKDIKLINYNNETNIDNTLEVWTEADCLLVKEDLLS